jgi:hypothetical protein
MIAEKISNVIGRLDKLEYMISPEAWRIISLALTELADAAGSVRGLETQQSLTPAGLTVIDLVSESDPAGKPAVSAALLGGLLGDIAEALRDIDDIRPTPRPRPAHSFTLLRGEEVD